jgi:hypothetical protein
MQTRLLFLPLLLALLTASALAQSRNATLIINGGTLIDGTGGPPVPDAAVVVSPSGLTTHRTSACNADRWFAVRHEDARAATLYPVDHSIP